MQINGQQYQSIWYNDTNDCAHIFDQTLLPHHIDILTLNSIASVTHAIKSMQVRGAPLIGACAAYGVYFILRDSSNRNEQDQQITELLATRPTAINLRWAVERVLAQTAALSGKHACERALQEAQAICAEDATICSRIGDHGLNLIRAISERKGGKTVNILTHCNAGWLATVDWGTALAPIYKAHRAGINVHVWVDETRPRLQGALTAFELHQAGVPHTYITDNAGGHVMQHNQVDLCIVGTDRTTLQGDVCNKIGTYLKALAAKDNGVPFYVALPSSTIDWTIADGVKEIPIEERNSHELTHVYGINEAGQLDAVQITPTGIHAINHAFDVTPARLIDGLITEFGVFEASVTGLARIKQALMLETPETIELF